MTWTSTRIPLPACVAVLMLAGFGCYSSLKVNVAVYDGPMLAEPDARLAWAVGLARTIRSVADDTRSDPKSTQLLSAQRWAKKNDAQRLLEDIVNGYDNLEIDRLVQLVQDDLTRKEAQRLLAVALIAYGHQSQAIASRIGMPELYRGFKTPLYWLTPVPDLRPNEMFVAAMVTIDESGRILAGLGESVIAEADLKKGVKARCGPVRAKCDSECRCSNETCEKNCRDTCEAKGEQRRQDLGTLLAKGSDAASADKLRSEIEAEEKKCNDDCPWLACCQGENDKCLANCSALEEVCKKNAESPKQAYLLRIRHIMSSQAPGTLLTVIKNQPTWYRSMVADYIEKVYGDRYWKSINPLKVRAIGGDMFTMLVKDEVGNWQLRTVTMDDSKLAEALVESARAAVQVAASVAGAP